MSRRGAELAISHIYTRKNAQLVKARLHEQIFCGNFSVTNVFDRVDERTNNCWSLFKSTFERRYLAQIFALFRGLETIIVMWRPMPDFLWRVIYTSNFSYVATFICHIKANTPAFQQMLAKNWPISLVHTSK